MLTCSTFPALISSFKQNVQWLWVEGLSQLLDQSTETDRVVVNYQKLKSICCGLGASRSWWLLSLRYWWWVLTLLELLIITELCQNTLIIFLTFCDFDIFWHNCLYWQAFPIFHHLSVQPNFDPRAPGANCPTSANCCWRHLPVDPAKRQQH